MNGILQQKSEVEKLQREYKLMAEANFNRKNTPTTINIEKEELILEECEL